MLEWIPTIVSFIFLGLTAYLLHRTASYADKLSNTISEVKKFQLRLTELETDFTDKYEHTLRKFTGRNNMRKKRDDESEDSNTPEVLVPV